MLNILRRARAEKPPEPAVAADPNVPRNLVQSVPHLFEAVEEEAALFDSLWTEYSKQHGTPHDPMRVMMFMYLLKIANATAPADYIELGTHRGLTARLIYKLMDPSRTLFLADTFEGFVERDLVVERKIYPNGWREGNFSPTSADGVKEYVGDGKAPDNVVTIKGWFPESYVGLESKSWRFVHIDFDLYQPIRAAVDIVWPQLVPGGVMIVHDYGCFGFPGAKIAVDEFADSIGVTAVPMADRWGSAIFIKPKRPTSRVQEK